MPQPFIERLLKFLYENYEKSKLNIKLNYKQYEFDKEVSISFNIPKNYKRK